MEATGPTAPLQNLLLGWTGSVTGSCPVCHTSSACFLASANSAMHQVGSWIVLSLTGLKITRIVSPLASRSLSSRTNRFERPVAGSKDWLSGKGAQALLEAALRPPGASPCGKELQPRGLDWAIHDVPMQGRRVSGQKGRTGQQQPLKRGPPSLRGVPAATSETLSSVR
jgi:hypothetical protein